MATPESLTGIVDQGKRRNAAVWISRLLVKCLSLWGSCTQWPKTLVSTTLLMLLFRSRCWRLSKRALKSGSSYVSSLADCLNSEPDDAPGGEYASTGEGSVTPPTARFFGHDDDLFELGQRLKNGSQGIVYECTRIVTGSKYAAKVVDTSPLVRSQKELALLRREICIMRELHHPKIVNIFTAYFSEKDCIIVMDIAQGGDLFDLINSELQRASSCGEPYAGLGGNEIVSKHIAQQLVEGISYMHWNNVIHRDLKLDNILIMQSYPSPDVRAVELHDIKIADFGLSTKMQSMAYNGYMTAAGTPSYVAPEVLDETYDCRADFWSFGVILYAMFCGQMPFHISSMKPDKHKVQVSQISACESWDLVSQNGREVVLGLLTVDPDQRLCLEGCIYHPWFADEDIPLSPGFRKRTTKSGDAFNEAPMVSRATRSSSRAVNGVVRQISGWTGSNVQSAQLLFADGVTESYGEANDHFVMELGFQRQCSPFKRQSSPFQRQISPTLASPNRSGLIGATGNNDARAVHAVYDLEPDEFIIGVMQDRFFGDGSTIGNALVFYTSSSRIIALQGTEARRRHRFVAPAGWQIVGLQFEGTVITGTHVERVTDGTQGSVRQISGRTGSAVDSVSLHLSDGSKHAYGHEGGSEKGPWRLEPSEVILVVEQGHKERYLGASIAFYTSAGNVFKLSGVTAFPSRRFAVASGEQLCNLEFEGGLLSKVCTCPRNGDLQKSRWHTLT